MRSERIGPGLLARIIRDFTRNGVEGVEEEDQRWTERMFLFSGTDHPLWIVVRSRALWGEH